LQCSFQPVVRFRALVGVVIELAVVVELREQFYVWEMEQDEWENAFLAREHNVVEAERALRRVCMECDAIRDQAGAAQQDN
jgi:hypothetical protein